MITIRSLARPLLSAVFISGGVETLRDPKPRIEKAAQVVPGMAKTLPLPADPELLVKINAGVQVGAGALLATGRLPRLAALVLIGSAIPTTYAGHRFWEMEDKQTRAQQQIHFLKNLGLIGGLLLAAVDTGGAPSVSWRVRHRAAQVRRTATRPGPTLGGRAGRAGAGGALARRARSGRALVGPSVHAAAQHLPVS